MLTHVLLMSQVHTSLQDWSGGCLKKMEFNADLFEDVYHGHKLFMSNICHANTKKCHHLLSSLYNDIRCVVLLIRPH